MTKEMIERLRARHAFADIALLIITVALVVSLVIAATVVSIGMARADTLGTIAGSNGERFALAIVLAFVVVGLVGLTAVVARDGARPQRRR